MWLIIRSSSSVNKKFGIEEPLGASLLPIPITKSSANEILKMKMAIEQAKVWWVLKMMGRGCSFVLRLENLSFVLRRGLVYVLNQCRNTYNSHKEMSIMDLLSIHKTIFMLSTLNSRLPWFHAKSPNKKHLESISRSFFAKSQTKCCI